MAKYGVIQNEKFMVAGDLMEAYLELKAMFAVGELD